MELSYCGILTIRVMNIRRFRMLDRAREPKQRDVIKRLIEPRRAREPEPRIDRMSRMHLRARQEHEPPTPG